MVSRGDVLCVCVFVCVCGAPLGIKNKLKPYTNLSFTNTVYSSFTYLPFCYIKLSSI